MAHIEKFKSTQVNGVLLHNTRTGDTEQHNHSNEDIDTTRTKDNYELHSTEGTAYERFKARMEQVHCMKRDDVTVFDSLVVTLPKDVKDGDERKFFEAVYAFACGDYGKENIINATVHKDETKPHIHVGFIPVVTGKLRNGKPCEKVRHSALITKTYLDQFHTRLSDFVKEQLGYEVEILNGATAGGNKTVQELKADRAKHKADQLQQRVDELEVKVKEQEQTIATQEQTIATQEQTIAAYEQALTAAEADTKETKTVKGMFGKAKEVPKTADELDRDKAIVGAKLVLQREGAVKQREDSVKTDRQLLASTVNNAVALERQEGAERQRKAVARAREEEQAKAEQECKQLQRDRDRAVKELAEERSRSERYKELATDYAYLVNDLDLPTSYKDYAEQLWQQLEPTDEIDLTQKDYPSR